MIEEAAGVLKYRRRKEKAERKLAATEGNLTRLHDLLREVRRQLRPLERQADAARRHGDLVAELQHLRRFQAGRELTTLQGPARGRCATTRRELAEEERALKASLVQLDTAVVATEAELSVDGRRRRLARTWCAPSGSSSGPGASPPCSPSGAGPSTASAAPASTPP